MSGVQSAAPGIIGMLLCGVLLLFRFSASGRFAKQLAILGSTGSIGCSTLDVVRHNPDSFRVIARWWRVKCRPHGEERCTEFSPRLAVMDDTSESAEQLEIILQQHGSRTEVLSD